VAESAEEFTSAVATLQRDAAQRIRVGQQGRESTVSRSWSAIFTEVYGNYMDALRDGILPRRTSPHAALLASAAR
jgi:hypothetical protein